MADKLLRYTLFHGSIKVDRAGTRDGKDWDGYARAGEELELSAAAAKSMDPKGEMLMLSEEFAKVKELALKNAELEHQRRKRLGKEKKPTPLPVKVSVALRELTEKALAELTKADAGDDDEKPPKPTAPKSGGQHSAPTGR